MLTFLINPAAFNFAWAESALKEITTAINPVVTALATLCFVVCLIGMLFSKNQKAVEEYKTWLKRILVCYFIFFCSTKILQLIEGLGESANTATASGS